MAQSIKEAFKGVGEIFIFVPAGIDRFSAEKKDALKSFIIPVLFYPVILAGFAVRNDIHDLPTLLVHAVVSWAAILGFFYIIWEGVKNSPRREYFWRFVSAANWTVVINMVLFAIGVYGYNVVGGLFEQYWVFYLIVDMLYVGFVVANALRLPWMLGAFAATLNLFLSDVGFRVIMSAHDHLVA